MKKTRSAAGVPLPELVLRALETAPVRVREVRAVSRHVTKKLGGDYVKTKAGWEKLVAAEMARGQVILRAARATYVADLTALRTQVAQLKDRLEAAQRRGVLV